MDVDLDQIREEVKQKLSNSELIAEFHEKHKLRTAFRKTDLGNLFEKFVMLHERAVRLDTELNFDEDCSWQREKRAVEALKESEEVENKLREILMEIVEVKQC